MDEPIIPPQQAIDEVVAGVRANVPNVGITPQGNGALFKRERASASVHISDRGNLAFGIGTTYVPTAFDGRILRSHVEAAISEIARHLLQPWG